MRKKGLLFLFFAAFVLLLNLMIPPMQNPDEPQHFAAVMAFAKNVSPVNVPQSEIISLMDKNRWWHFLGMGRPEPLPEKIADVSFLMGYNKVSDFTLFLNYSLIYHFATGKFIGLFAIDHVAWAYYLARLISIFFFAGALRLFYLSFKRMAFPSIVPDGFPWLLFGFFFIIFLPQFLISSVSVNSDSLSIFLSAIFFFAAFSLIGQDHQFRMAIILVSSLITGLIVDRANFFMLPAGLFAILFSLDRKNIKKHFLSILLLLAASTLLFFSLKLFFPAQLAKGFNSLRANLPHALSALKSMFSFDSLDRNFFLDFIDSFLLKFGWSAFSASSIFHIVWRLIIAMSCVGIFRYIVKSLRKRAADPNHPARLKSYSSNDPTRNSLFLRYGGFSIATVFFQILAMRTISTQRTMFAQGRYLFPLILPIAFLLIIGLKNFFDIFDRKMRLGVRAIKVMLIFQFLFLNYVIWNEIVPVFHLILKSPHPGG